MIASALIRTLFVPLTLRGTFEEKVSMMTVSLLKLTPTKPASQGKTAQICAPNKFFGRRGSHDNPHHMFSLP